MIDRVYILSDGVLKRKDNSLIVETEKEGKKFIPVEKIKEIYVFSELTLNKRVLEFITKNLIILHFFNHYGYYIGSFYPREHYNSGFMTVNQVRFYLDKDKRLYLAKQFVLGAGRNILKVLSYYNRRGKELKNYIDDILKLIEDMLVQDNIESVMSYEANIKKIYYNSFNIILNNEDFKFKYRNKRPPIDFINTLISFSNSLVYVQVLSEIYRTHLDPRIGYLHTSNFRRFTLNLDVAEIFKVVIGDKVIFSVLNKNIITKKDFDIKIKGLVLKENGMKKFLSNFEEKLQNTIKHSKLKRKVSYKKLIRMELYKLEKHFIGEEKYLPFVMDW